jgi:sugar/nucleoside kinase (ribokinase family)
VLATDGVAVTVAPFAVDPVDTNGAGDTHIGSFIARMAAGDQPLRAAQYANVAAALSTLTRGPATAPPRPDVEARMATATPSKKAG